MAETCDFSLRHYETTLAAYKAAGYSFRTFCDFQRETSHDPRPLLLRHDVDKSVTKALWMARVEKSLGIKATYFIRVHSNYYNPFGHVTYRQIKEIDSLGHEIGLHTEFYDAARINGEDSLRMFGREKTVLETITGRPVLCFSPHRTTGSSVIEEIQGRLPAIRETYKLSSAYDERFQNGLKYLSDSSGMWREGCFCQHIGKHAGMQILTHPDWWFADHIELEDPVV